MKTRKLSSRESELQLAELSVMVHVALAVLHLLGASYNLKRRNKWDVVAHAAAAIYDIRAVSGHLHDIKVLEGGSK